jgi:hypothetical protein
MDAKTFFRELKRRNVYKVAAAYAVIAWLLIEAASLLLSGHEERTSAVTALVVILALGFVLALYISWVFEATPQGMKRTENLPPDAVLPSWSPRKLPSSLSPSRCWRLVCSHLMFYGAEVNRLRLPQLPRRSLAEKDGEGEKVTLPIL